MLRPFRCVALTRLIPIPIPYYFRVGILRPLNVGFSSFSSSPHSSDSNGAIPLPSLARHLSELSNCSFPTPHSETESASISTSSLSPRIPVSFLIPCSSVRILSSPSEYYSTLVELSSTVSRRVVLSALYLGSVEPKERKLVETLTQRAEQCIKSQSEPLSIHFVLDYLRGLRPVKSPSPDLAPAVSVSNSVTALSRLLSVSPSSVRVSLISSGINGSHTAHWLDSILSRLISTSDRLQELFGVHHMKFCVFDSTVIISGANLSEQYFTDRQDRYVVIENVPELAEFYSTLAQILEESQFAVNAKFSNAESTANNVVNSNNFSCRYFTPFGCISLSRASWLERNFQRTAAVEQLKRKFEILFFNKSQTIKSNSQSSSDTISTSTTTSTTSSLCFLLPTLQWSSIGIFQDSKITQQILKWLKQHNEIAIGTATSSLSSSAATAGVVPVPVSSVSSSSPFSFSAINPINLSLSTGYLNLTTDYIKLLTHEHAQFQSPSSISSPLHSGEVRILCSSPRSNGWFGGSGWSRFVPDIYWALEREIIKTNKSSAFQIWEYEKLNWTFHAKGLWMENETNACSRVFLSMIGSPNFGWRSSLRDIETSLILITEPQSELAKQLTHEKQRLFQYAKPIKLGIHEPQNDRSKNSFIRFIARIAKSYL